MASSANAHRDRGFRPVDTLASAQAPTFSAIASSSTAKMVKEREPPRMPNPQYPIPSALQDRTNEPTFGKASPLRNPLKQDHTSSVVNAPAHTRSEYQTRPPPHAVPRAKPVFKHPDIFNIPKPNQARPEHHRPIPPSTATVPNGLPGNPVSKLASFMNEYSVSPPAVGIPRPINPAPRTLHPAPRPLYSSAPAVGFQPINAVKKPQPITAPTSRDDDDDDGDDFDPNKALADDGFGAFDPQNYMDAAQASDNIKALLEGAFEDDNDKPKTRSRRKKQDAAAAALADKMQALDINVKQEKGAEGEEEEDDGSVEGLNVRLLPHQIDGLAWMLDKEIGERKRNGVLPKGGILADDMGLGKTIQALSLLLSNPRPSADDLAQNPGRKIPEAAGKGTLVVVPLALIKQWESEIKTKVEKFPKLKVLVHHGASRTKRYEDLKKYDVVITTYQTLTSEHDGSSDSEKGIKVGCFGVHWYRVILDEAHSIKNRNAKMTKAAYALKSVYRWCLTGTPMQNNLDELQSLIAFLRIKPYNDLRNWKDQIGQPMKNGRGGLAMKRLQYFLKAFMKRRTKEVLKKEGGLKFGRGTHANDDMGDGGFKIVERKVETIVAEFDEDERLLYDRLAARTEKSLEDMMGSTKNDYIGALVLLLRLRQTCNHPDLIRGNLRKEKDHIATNSQTAGGLLTPRKTSSTAGAGMDDIADMFGALTVQTKKCDVCQTKLGGAEVAAGAIRCSECEADLIVHRRSSKEHRSSKKLKKQSLPNQQPRRRMHTKRILDSEDEEEEGDWVVPRSQQQVAGLGKAGGSDDEDAEGGGEWIKADDSDTGDDSEVNIRKFTRRARESTVSRANNDDSLEAFVENDGTSDDHDDDGDDGDEQSSSDDVPTLASSTKIRRLIQILHKESDEHKFIVFSEFTSMLDLIEPFLQKEGFRFTRYDGSMKNDDREASLERLRNDPRTRILLCSLRCGSLGLNLTAASRVVILEPFWNPFVEEQAIDRVHRLNQTRDVAVYRLTIANSVEERILDLQEKKRQLATMAIEGGKAVAKLSMKDILSLFRRDAEHDGRHEDGVGGMAGIAKGRSAGLLGPGAGVGLSLGKVVSPVKKVGGGREASKWQIPPSLKGQFDESFGRRW